MTTFDLHRHPGHGLRGLLRAGPHTVPAALGPAGLTARKREGDGATPLGAWGMREVFYRPDRMARPRTGLPVRPFCPRDGWCDAPGDRNYNRPVTLPYPASAERLWRDDHVYDLLVVLDYNLVPRVRGRGSAIFLHLAKPDFSPTEGCVAVRRADLLRILSVCGPESVLRIGP